MLTSIRFPLCKIINTSTTRLLKRTFLSQAYYCNEVWEHRLNSPILQKVNLDELYHALDQRFQRHRQMSAVDVDVFANAVKEDSYVDELLDLVHKLRLTADTRNTLNSTSHAVVRYLTQCNESNRLLEALDDRLNYGIFLDHYTANILMDIYWKNKDYTSGARVASQLMLQEETDHPLFSRFALLHCYHYLLDPKGWPEYVPPEEPEEEVKVRVKYIRNPYDDDHFDLRDPAKIVGKTIAMLTRQKSNTLDKCFYIVGMSLYNKLDKAKAVVAEMAKNKEKLFTEVLRLLPDEHEIKAETQSLPTDDADVSQILQERVKKAEQIIAEKDIATQCETFSAWEEERKQALEHQHQRLLAEKRLIEIQETQKQLKDRESRLWFFENEEKIELEIQEKEAVVIPQEEPVKKQKSSKKIDEDYIPPEIRPNVKRL